MVKYYKGKKFQEEWKLLTLYEKFEKIICLVLSVFIALIILSAMYRLGYHLLAMIFQYGVDPLDYKTFKKLFGMVLIVLIALEFKHSIVKVVVKNESVVQVKTVVLIALLAIARKMIILDTKAMPANTIFALAAVMLALGLVYWLMRERDDRKEEADENEQEEA